MHVKIDLCNLQDVVFLFVFVFKKGRRTQTGEKVRDIETEAKKVRQTDRKTDMQTYRQTENC